MRLVSSVCLLLVFALGCSRIPSCRGGVKGIPRMSQKVDVACTAAAGQRPRDGCVTGELRCGVQLQDSTDGGQNNWGDEFYKGKYCVPFPSGYSGAERIYKLSVPAHTMADVWLDTPCADLDLFSVRWRYDGKCPGTSHLVSECESDAGTGTGHVRVVSTTRDEEYLIAVDGKQGKVAPFALSVDCSGGPS